MSSSSSSRLFLRRGIGILRSRLIPGGGGGGGGGAGVSGSGLGERLGQTRHMCAVAQLRLPKVYELGLPREVFYACYWFVLFSMAGIASGWDRKISGLRDDIRLKKKKIAILQAKLNGNGP